jgi:hypothetical protein
VNSAHISRQDFCAEIRMDFSDSKHFYFHYATEKAMADFRRG